MQKHMITVTVGDVTIRTVAPLPEEVQRNIKAGQAALRRAGKALITPGVVIVRKKGVPLYYGSKEDPHLIVRELNGEKTVGKFVGGRFRPIGLKLHTSPI